MAMKLMKGNHALAEAAVRAGCRFFGGYPITPQTEILEYLSARLPEVGGTFLQAESELGGVNMVYGAAAAGCRAMTSSSGPGFSLLQEGISYIASGRAARRVRGCAALRFRTGRYFPGSERLFHRDPLRRAWGYKLLVYAPASVQESVDLTVLAFDKADQYRNPALILSDASIAQMMEPVELPEMREVDFDRPWAARGRHGGENKRISSTMYYIENFDQLHQGQV